ncbi:lysosomal thioesterase PPT2 isoform X2 [Protopterus annectens]|uniref:lysosomal thioesterase PPT2 isoform X2 n=1 Tax=Protopterus annectens TaxID=7888 RepID=UPI001CFB24D9|nr:lysosomal thioesterase PPT2 isoform X2 [Protopterus annectens]
MMLYRKRHSCHIVPLCFCSLLWLSASCYKPVIIVHGLFDSSADFVQLLGYINQTHPGTNVTVIDLFDRSESLKPMWMQVQGFQDAISPIMQNAANGVHLICYSQGGLVCRGVLSIMSNHNVDTFISLSSPQMGQYGDTEYIKLFPHYVKKNLFRFCYTQLGQTVSVCNYWKEWKKNFLRIKKLILIGGPDDGVITPWQSSHFGFYDENETVIDMTGQEAYLKDTFGLKTLAARGDIVTYSVNGVEHTKWHDNETVFKNCIAKWLT